ncbi:tRNA lysidine(34) synthetase TilS [Clostridium sp. P21]|uniref:tRNA(Ile)-lysidine synthase n=1 Tax=Clostridium muellerianum TaxID=2716538 RepID=A0A7Y0EES4_9CLOT|nr:tRNA lysidine(34) synthetase TilS [Clostridium muellerianum]NMM62171.1 tRNA lysidine(34) synthetase TilS [Clostridium muellerianum]
MINTVLKTINKYRMFNEGDKVIVAVSGGPDSICLLHILYSLRNQLNIQLCAAHVNHCLRGDEADKDEEYVRKFCEDLNIEFRSRSVDINKMMEKENISCESAGRKARYDFFNNVKKELNAQKIAIAHNANDQAETILMRIMRGTGLEGLMGIKAVRDDVFVRPLINTTRQEIEEYCDIQNIKPRIDKTNLETIYSRNRVRLQLIPYIQENFNKDIVKVLNRLSDTIKIDNEYLEIVAKEKFKRYCDIQTEKVIISKEAFLENEAIITRIIRKALYTITGTLNNFEKVHIYDIIDVQSKSTGKDIDLANNIIVSNKYGDIHILKKSQKSKVEENKSYFIHKGVNDIKEYRLRVITRIVDSKENVDFKSSRLTKYFDYDKVGNEIIIRHRREGDKFVPLGMKGNKKLKDFFMDEKITKDQRQHIPIICFDNEIGWVVGYRVSELFKVNENTKNILEIKVERIV